MKTFAVVLVCLFAAVQGRSTGLEVHSEAALGENPWVVHLRVAESTSGFLRSCIGTLISNTWILTSASCILDARFIWIRYGAVNVINPQLVTETNVVRTHPNFDLETGENDIALVGINRLVQSTENISPAQLASADSDEVSSGVFCGYGFADDEISPGEVLKCFDVAVEASEDGSLVASSEDVAATRNDIGAALINDGVQYGVLVRPADDSNAGVFLKLANYLDWINTQINSYDMVDDDGGSEVYVAN